MVFLLFFIRSIIFLRHGHFQGLGPCLNSKRGPSPLKKGILGRIGQVENGSPRGYYSPTPSSIAYNSDFPHPKRTFGQGLVPVIFANKRFTLQHEL